MQFSEIRIENTNSCCYRCVMCPRELQTRKIGFMSVEDFCLVLDQIGPFSGSFHLHGYGEPLLDRHLIEKMSELKKRNPIASSCIITTLGVNLEDDYFIRLAKAGLNFLVVSMYGFTHESYRKIHGFDGLDLVNKNLENLRHAGIDVLIKVPAQNTIEKEQFCGWAKNSGFKTDNWPYVHNYGNGRHFNPPNVGGICPVISGKRRHILHITWDLSVIPCCYDFNASICFGNLRKQSLKEIFSSPAYLHFYLAHQTGSLANYPICQNCEKIDAS